ncbi:hypothetical protein ACS3UN_13195 [Oscillospiraceae bacterium LTW-04]|nr:hypothetical protein RBH76_01005 [Oscillospiraceae bacterium MB24-C1]
MDIEGILLTITLANIFFLSTGLAGVGFGYASEICAVLLLGVLLVGARRFFRNLTEFFTKTKSAVLISMAVYLSADAANFFIFGDLALAWQKYRVVVVLILLFASLCILRRRPDLTRLLLLVVGMSSVVVSICTLAYYFLPFRLPLYYTARFSMRRDYNMYATQLVTGLIALVFGVIATKNKKAMMALTAALPVILAVSVLSGSRRVLIMLPVVLPVVTVSLVAAGIKLFGTCRAGAVIGCLVVVTALTVAETALFQHGLTQINAPGSQTRSIAQAPAVETELSERYETIRSSSILEKRKVIWGIAIEALLKYSVPELIFGRGGGENISLYDKTTTPLDAIYPDRQARLGALSAHNMMLADLLDGGVIKLAALLYLVFVSGISCIIIALKRPFIGLPIGMILAVCMINSMVSNRFGLLYDRYFVLFTALAAIEYQTVKVLIYDRRIKGGNSR